MEIANYMYLSNWVAWPKTVQKFIPMVLMIVQKRRPIYGFGIVLCDLETFKEVRLNETLLFDPRRLDSE